MLLEILILAFSVPVPVSGGVLLLVTCALLAVCSL